MLSHRQLERDVEKLHAKVTEAVEAKEQELLDGWQRFIGLLEAYIPGSRAEIESGGFNEDLMAKLEDWWRDDEIHQLEDELDAERSRCAELETDVTRLREQLYAINEEKIEAVREVHKLRSIHAGEA